MRYRSIHLPAPRSRDVNLIPIPSFAAVITAFSAPTLSQEVATLHDGALYLVRPASVKGSRECIYNDAVAAVRQSSSGLPSHDLVITKVFDEGEAELQDEDAENDEERIFHITSQLLFQFVDEHGKDPFLSWRDPLGDVGDRFEFRLGLDSDRAQVQAFATLIQQCMGATEEGGGDTQAQAR